MSIDHLPISSLFLHLFLLLGSISPSCCHFPLLLLISPSVNLYFGVFPSFISCLAVTIYLIYLFQRLRWISSSCCYFPLHLLISFISTSASSVSSFLFLFLYSLFLFPASWRNHVVLLPFASTNFCFYLLPRLLISFIYFSVLHSLFI